MQPESSNPQTGIRGGGHQAVSSWYEKGELGICPECGQRARISKRIRDFFRGRMRQVSAPERFKTRLTRSIRAIRVEF